MRWFFDGSTAHSKSSLSLASPPWSSSPTDENLFYRRQDCTCTRPIHVDQNEGLVISEASPSLCSHYSTLRGAHQRVMAISMYGPKENAMFGMNASLNFLHELIADMTKIYPGWILRVYHDASIRKDIVCPIECAHRNVDFCNASALIHLGDVAEYMPPKIWRFLPAGDPMVDIMGSRDLDSPLTPREQAAVNEWIGTNQPWHVMRDHPLHTVPMLGKNSIPTRIVSPLFHSSMLGGMWDFRPELNRTFANKFLQTILNQSVVAEYGGRADQNFLEEYIWPYIRKDVIAHDSHLCQTSYGLNSRAWPTRRPPLNDSGSFVGCVRPCGLPMKYPFGECPKACRPKAHPDWTMC